MQELIEVRQHEHKAQHRAPEVVYCTGEPEKDLTKLRLEHPDAAKESEQAERVMLPAMTRDGVHEPDQGEKDNGIDKLKDDGRQEQEELHKKMRYDAAVHYVPVRGH